MRGMEKTGKVADARRAVASARLMVTQFAECLFDGGNFMLEKSIMQGLTWQGKRNA